MKKDPRGSKLGANALHIDLLLAGIKSRRSAQDAAEYHSSDRCDRKVRLVCAAGCLEGGGCCGQLCILVEVGRWDVEGTLGQRPDAGLVAIQIVCLSSCQPGHYDREVHWHGSGCNVR